MLEINNLHAKVENLKILKGIDLKIKSGEIHAIMGPNGSGKSTLCNVLMGHPKYKATEGTAKLNGKNLLTLDPNERANLGVFMAFQHPIEIPGVTIGNFLRLAKNANIKATSKKAAPLSPHEFMRDLKKSIALLKTDENIITRSLNEGFSGGEKKKAEIMQMAVLEPKIALLDEIDSGLDIDALKITATAIMEIFKKTKPAILLITHYQRILNYITPNFVHIMSEGKIIKSGDRKLALEIEKHGYQKYLK
ncbi:Fe-S cluster assembly ATPase SufC [Candidatus Peregrinibacteria bacterium]|nr:Fe-S cluster assembly ATPase SufC [Candidatus Peregrinibacteria bacterium]